MSDPTFERIQEAFHAVRDLPPAEREAYLSLHHGDDPELAAEVRSLLELDRPASDFIEPPPTLSGVGRLLPETLEPPSLVGRKVGSFTLTRLIATGGMGAVYEARQEHPRRQVAVKVMRAGLGSPEALRRFEYEAEILARLRHPAIAQVYEAGTYDDGTGPVPYFAMELVPDARTLVDHARERCLDLPARLALFTELCEAVHHGHLNGIIHRDLKPANILVDGSGRLKVIDFGVARATDADVSVYTQQTRLGQIVGTLQYMSPEQWKADPASVDVRADVYALGMILYELLCGQTAYDLKDVALHEMARRVMLEPPRRPGTVNTTLRGDLETIILKALEKDRQRRYASAADLGRDLTRYLNHQPIEARPPSLAYQLRMLARRNRAAFSALAATFVVLLAAAVVSTVFAVRAHHAERDASARAQAETRARERADRLFTRGRGLARWVIFDFLNALQKLPGATQAQESLTRQVLTYLDGLTVEAGDNPALFREVAAAYQRMAGVLGDPNQHNLGHSRGALESYQKALAIYEKRLAADPDHESDRRMHARLVLQVGTMLGVMGDHRAARAHYDRALSELQALRRIASDPASVDRDISFCHENLGNLLKESGHLDAARNEYARVLAQAEAAIRARPEDALARRDLALAHARMGEIQEALGRYDEAQESYRRMAEYAEAARGEDPTDLLARRDLSVACVAAGDLFTQTGDMDAALTNFLKALKIRQVTASDNPASASAQLDLAVNHQRLGDVYQCRKDLPRAFEHAHSSLRIAERLLVADPDNVAILRLRWIAEDKMASIRLAERRLDEAFPLIRQALAHAEALVERDPDSTVDRQGVAQGWDNLGNYHLWRPDQKAPEDDLLAALQAATDCYRKSLDTMAAIRERAEWSANQKNFVAAVQKKLTMVRSSLEALEK